MKIDIFTGVVLVDKNDRIYLIKEEDKNRIGKGRWNLPGGSIDDNESFITSAHRETLEETGYHSKIGSIVGIYHCCKQGNYWMYIVFDTTVTKKEKIKVKDISIKEGRWFEKKEFLDMNTALMVHEDMKLVYKKVIEKKGAFLDTVKFIDYDKQ